MDDPQVQYTRTSDRADIAYWTLGEGPPLLWLNINPAIPWRVYQHLEVERAWDDQLAQEWGLVKFDHRGVGLSGGVDVDRSLDARVLDMEAVVDAASIDTFALWATFLTGPLAIAYAARHPEQITHLFLWCTYAVVQEYLSSPAAVAARAVRTGSDWPTLVQTLSTAASGWSHPEYAHRLAESWVEQQTKDEYESAQRLQFVDDVRDLLPSVEAPTLVIHHNKCVVPLDSSRRLAVGMPNARLVEIEGDSVLPALGNGELLLAMIRDHIGLAVAPAVTPPATPSDFRTILFTDVEASTALTDRFGDAKARALLREHERLTRDALAVHGGTEIKTMGDGFMASFTSASSALDAAIAMQQAITEHFADSETPIRIRVGINAGEPIEEANDLYGASVIRAARVMGQADGGEILVTNVVRELVEGKEYRFSDRGAADLKGFDEAVRLFEVRWGR